ncbi:MAG: hypothetical protein WA973_16415 [Mesorhizobium sp.]
MMRKPYSAPNYDDPVEWLTPPEYYHAPLRAGEHTIPVAADAIIVEIWKDVGPDGESIQSLTVIVRRSDGC